MNEVELLAKVNQVLGKDMTQKSLFETIEDLCLKIVKIQEDIEIKNNQIQTIRKSNREYLVAIESLINNEEILLEQNKKYCLQLKEMKYNSRLTRFWEMAEENLKLAQEVARLKGEVPV